MTLHHKKTGFTLMELLLIVVLVSLVTAMARPFFNVNRQDKILFGENCINYIFNKIDTFQYNIKYGKSDSATISGENLSASRVNFIGNDISTGVVVSRIDFRLISAVDEYDYPSEQFSQDSMPSATGRPIQCKNPNYVVGFTMPAGFNNGLAVYTTKPTTTQGETYINSGSYDKIQSIVTGDVMIHVCNVSAMGTGTLPTAASICLEMGKVYIDRRASTIKGVKCLKTNPITGICSVWPLY